MISDSVMVALVAGVFNVLAIVVGRLLSRKEHMQTQREVQEIKRVINGGK